MGYEGIKIEFKRFNTPHTVREVSVLLNGMIHDWDFTKDISAITTSDWWDKDKWNGATLHCPGNIGTWNLLEFFFFSRLLYRTNC